MSASTEGRADPASETPRERAVYALYRGAQWLALALPEAVGRGLFDVVAHVAFRLAPRMRAVVSANQARVLGRDPSDRLVRESAEEAFELYARYWFESFRLPAWSAEELERRTDVVGAEHIDAALEKGRGCVIALGHLGNWDAAGACIARRGYRVASVNEALRPRRLFDLFREHREAFGVTIVGLDAPNLGVALAGFLERNMIVALLADRDLSGRGVEVEMFGATRRIPSGPASLALSSGAPLLLCSVATTGRGWRVRISAPLEIEPTGDRKEDVRALTRRLAAGFERAIAEHPADWHLFQPAWP
ncbi:MAG: phosphatidylinositol mannoside acyltransferase [Actinomycetota bacterium]